MNRKKSNKWKTKALVFLPENLNLALIITQHAPFKGFKLEKLEYIISLVFEIPANNKTIQDINGFVPIHADTLESEIWDYKRYLDYLIKIEVFETDGHYINGIKSKGYRIREEYCTQVIPRLRMTELSHIDQIKCTGGKRKYSHLFKWFNDELSIDLEGAILYLQKEFEENQLSEESSYRKAIDRYNQSIVNVIKILNRNYNVKIDANIGRLHSPITNLRSDLRPFLRYKGQRMVNIDLKNSQPYLSARLLENDFWSEKWQNKGDISGRIGIKDINGKNKYLGDIEVYIMIWKKERTQASIELQKYLNIILSGQLYEYFQPLFIQEMGEDYHDRQLVKRQVLMCLYSDNKYLRQPEAAAKRLFKAHFPTVYQLYSKIKEGDKKNLSWILQKIESHSILNVVTKQISKAAPEVPIFTIHDSILTTEGNEQIVAEIMEVELTKLIGFKPSLKIDQI